MRSEKNNSFQMIWRKISELDLIKYVEKWFSSVSANDKLVFYIACITGFLTHMFMMSSRYVNEDSIGLLVKTAAETSSGRWMNNIVNNIMYGYVNPFLTGIFSVFSMAVAAAVINSLINMKSKRNAVILGLILPVFPTFAHTSGYNYELAGYTLAFLFAVLSVYITKKYKYGFFCGAIFLMLTIAIYQAYVGVAIGMVVILILIRIIDKMPLRDIWKEGGKYLLMGILGVCFYYLSVSISLRVTGQELLDYRGISSFGQLSLKELPVRIKGAYQTWITAVSGKAHYTSRLVRLAYLLVIICTMFFVIKTIISTKVYKKKLHLFFFFIFFVTIPIAFNPTAILEPYVGTVGTLLTRYSFVLLVPLSLAMAERAKGFLPLIMNVYNISLIIMVINFIVVSNIYYLKLNQYYEMTYSLTTRIVGRIDLLMEGSAEKKVAIVGSFPNEEYPTTSRTFDITIPDQGLWGPYIGYNDETETNTYKFILNCNDIHGVKYTSPSQEEFEMIKREAKNHPIWPHKNSVFVYNDVIIINIGREK